MSKSDKREKRIRENPSNVSLEDLEALIRKYSCIEFGGNHPKAIIGKTMFPYKRTNPVKPPYVEGIIELIDKLK